MRYGGMPCYTMTFNDIKLLYSTRSQEEVKKDGRFALDLFWKSTQESL